MSTIPIVSVIICTHNPRRDYLNRVLESLKSQSLPKEQWEMLLIDNASNEQIADSFDLSWHPHARTIRENELGLTPARLRGINESSSDLLIFVDDDNVLEQNYLAHAYHIGIERAYIGAWGGRISGEYETPVPSEIKDHLEILAIREFSDPRWMYVTGFEAIPYAPCGAGICIRRSVALHYSTRLRNRPLLFNLGRRGNALTSGEDTDMALCACDIGLAIGQFPTLRILHLIPAARLSRDYILRLAENIAYSSEILKQERDPSYKVVWPYEPCFSDRCLGFYKRIRMRLRGETLASFHDAVSAAQRRGIIRAYNYLRDTSSTS